MPSINRYRSDLDELVRLARVDLSTLWASVSDGVVGRNVLATVLPELTAVYGSGAATLAADWYDEARELAGVSGGFTARAASAVPDAARTGAMARWAVEPMFAAEPDALAALGRAEGALQRLIADVGRETMSSSAVADPGARGWQRVGDGECGFCAMLISRGAVYTEATATFGSHDHCRCAAEPAWGGRPLPVKPYAPGPRAVTDADRARVRDWIKENGLT